MGYFWHLDSLAYLLVLRNNKKVEKWNHNDQKFAIIFVQFGSNLVPFLLLSQLNHLKIMLDSKNGVVLASTHFGLSTGAKKIRNKTESSSVFNRLQQKWFDNSKLI